jgi:hypothetical protein
MTAPPRRRVPRRRIEVPPRRRVPGAAVNRTTLELIARLTRALGAPAATPEWVSAGDGQLERARYRVFRWRCPACRGGYDDWLYRPLTVDSDGRVFCGASFCTADQIAQAAAVAEMTTGLLYRLEGKA